MGFGKRGERGFPIQVGGASFGSRVCKNKNFWLGICVD